MASLYLIHVDQVDNATAHVTITRAMPDETRPEGRGFALMMLLDAARTKGRSCALSTARDKARDASPSLFIAVSYTHLTLPTICSV